MAEIRSFKDLMAWQKAMARCERVYEITRQHPADERFGLTSQMRRAAVAVPSNIAEGYGRRATGDYIRFLQIALGSLYELETQLILSSTLGLSSPDLVGTCSEQLREVDRVLYTLIQALRDSPQRK